MKVGSGARVEEERGREETTVRDKRGNRGPRVGRSAEERELDRMDVRERERGVSAVRTVRGVSEFV